MKQAIQISLDDLGRILIPAPLRERLRLSPGMTLIVESGEQGGVRLRPQPESTPLVEAGVTEIAPFPTARMWLASEHSYFR